MEKKKDFLNNTFIGYALKNVFIAGLVILGIVVLSLFLLKLYTKNGQSEIVPNLRGLVVEDAIEMIDRHNLKFEIIDSVFIRDKKLGTVIEQNPAPNTTVKPGRAIYLIINSKAVRKIVLPELRDLSLRQAQAMVKSLGINVGKVEYAPSEYRNLILDVKFNGQSLITGSSVPEGGSITLVAGNGYGEIVSGIAPNLIGMDLVTANSMISAGQFVLGGIIYDVEPMGNEQDYLVFRQIPEAGDPISPGTIIDVWLSKNPVQAKEDFIPPTQPRGEEHLKENVNDIEEFF
ncbi:MAG: PASTA domain-containing protein [Porphyromonadaceae bacterium]|nr:PASTA domain-containing protein [Porphyromonadaceae bacterium]